MGICRREHGGLTFHLRKRVPVRFLSIESRRHVGISLHTDSFSEAEQKAKIIWEQHLAGWEARLAGNSFDANERFEAASANSGKLDKLEAEAVLGGAVQPDIHISRALELFWILAAEETLGKSPDQVRRWRNPFKKAIANFVSVVGNLALHEICREDMLAFRQWWFERMRAKSLSANSANKDLIHLGKVLKTVNELKGLGLDLPLAGLSFKEGEARQRPSFSDSWIRDVLLAQGALDGLNSEARCIILGMVNTGYRPSEATGLLPEHINLEGRIPYISIEPDGRQLKSVRSRRVIPLAGVSLEAFQQCPTGFPRYRGNASLSATVNKFLRENGLLQTPDHTLYGLRHSFEDRMLAAGVDERIRRDLFGHRLNRERYGAGATLEHLHKTIQRIAL